MTEVSACLIRQCLQSNFGRVTAKIARESKSTVHQVILIPTLQRNGTDTDDET